MTPSPDWLGALTALVERLKKVGTWPQREVAGALAPLVAQAAEERQQRIEKLQQIAADVTRQQEILSRIEPLVTALTGERDAMRQALQDLVEAAEDAAPSHMELSIAAAHAALSAVKR